MALKEQIVNDIKAALLSGDRLRAETLKNAKAAILNEEVASGARESGLGDAEIEKVIAREVKKRHEAATMYDANGRPELADPERAEAAILEVYLPQQLTEEEITELVKTCITELGVSGPQAMGQVIGAVKARAGNTADGATVARVVKSLL